MRSASTSYREDESDEMLGVPVRASAAAPVPLSASLDRGRCADVGRYLTLHNARADYGPDEPRLIKRCQVMADRIFDPGFLREISGERTPA